MLFNLHVENLALIDEADIYFGDGLNILTGETGAGKSIILGSLGLALGEKVPRGMLRDDEKDAVVEAVFVLDNDAQRKALETLDIWMEEDQVTLTRRIVKGRSVSRINGMTASAGLLKEVASVLLDMHSQQEHQSLLYKRKHLAILDAFGGTEIRQAREAVAERYHRWQKALKDLEEFSSDEEQRQREIDFLKFEIEEIEKAAPVPGEDEELEERYRLLANGKTIMEALESAYVMTGYDEDTGAGNTIGRAGRELSSVAKYGRELEELSGQLEQLDGLLNDFNRELSDYLSRQQFSEEELYETEKRLDVLNGLKAKYGRTVEMVLEELDKKRTRLEQLEDYNRILEEKQALEADLKKQVADACGALTSLRRKWAAPLEREIAKGLKELNFLQESFSIHLTPLETCGANGADQAEFYMSTNPGAPMGPVAQVASGGELSRIMLAIKTIMARQDTVGTLIFDEIDAGISGRTAQKVSEKLKEISRNHQVICITHLPQIAAMADTHFIIEKNVTDGKTKSYIEKLDQDGMITELARMLGGAQITDAVLENAKEMKRMAAVTEIDKTDKTISV